MTGVWIGGGELAGRMARRTSTRFPVPIVWAGERTDVLDVLPACLAQPRTFRADPAQIARWVRQQHSRCSTALSG